MRTHSPGLFNHNFCKIFILSNQKKHTTMWTEAHPTLYERDWYSRLGDGELMATSAGQPPLSQLAARLSQPLMVTSTASSNQLRSLLQRPMGSAISSSALAAESGNSSSSSSSGMLLTHSSSSPMMGGTPVSTTRVWVPGIWELRRVARHCARYAGLCAAIRKTRQLVPLYRQVNFTPKGSRLKQEHI